MNKYLPAKFLVLLMLVIAVGVGLWRAVGDKQRTERAEEIRRLKEEITKRQEWEAGEVAALEKLRQEYDQLDDKAMIEKQQELSKGLRTGDQKSRQELQRQVDAIGRKIASSREKRQSLEVTIQVSEAGLKAARDVREANEKRLRDLTEGR